ncbi:LysR family transcriptional regulator [Gryllotalpicola ginsengisoli]|uniref:LysR family transcriptional regulator n=1 Tax=Gryllotalpicola ginsengisoli TaxID=444608 RepID=UPI0003B4BD0A|nr:LysR family transcriptional regulator [Gryllotalpicola ginsengisoli]
MELRQLRYFKAVVEAGSLTAAAAELHISQPPLSLAISKFEAELGVQLLTRSPRGVEPTSAGRYLLEEASRVLGELDDIRARLANYGAGVAGVVTIAAVPTLMRYRIPRLLASHAAEFPEVDVRLVDPPPWTAIDLLLERKADLAVVMVADGARFAERHRAELHALPWGTAPLVGAFPPDLDGEFGARAPLSAFHGEIVALPKRTLAVPSLPEAVEEAFDRHGIVPRELRVLETIQTCIPLIQAGMARSILPDPDGASMASAGLTLRPLEPAPRPLDVLALSRRGPAPAPAVSRLLERIASSRSAE